VQGLARVERPTEEPARTHPQPTFEAMRFDFVKTHEGFVLVFEEGQPPRGATPVEVAMREAGIVLAAFIDFLVGDTAPPESVMDAVAVFTGEDE
jgi:hypothetical protein